MAEVAEAQDMSRFQTLLETVHESQTPSQNLGEGQDRGRESHMWGRLRSANRGQLQKGSLRLGPQRASAQATTTTEGAERDGATTTTESAARRSTTGESGMRRAEGVKAEGAMRRVEGAKVEGAKR